MAKKNKTIISFKLVGVILGVAVGSFLVIDYTSCQLKEGVSMDTIDPNDFIYGDGITQNFCSITDFLDAEAIGIDFTNIVFNEGRNLEGLDGFGIPFDDTMDENIIEDPDGTIGGNDPDDVIIDEDDMIKLNTTDGDPIINATDVIPPEEEPEIPTPMLVDISLITDVTKVATDGTQETITSQFQFIPLEIFVEDTSNKDFSNGRFEIVLKIKTDPNIFVEGDGQFDIFLDNVTINQAPIPISYSGTTDQNGELIIDFVSPTGLTSKEFLLNVAPLTPNIRVNGITPLEFKIIDLSAKAFEVDYAVTGLPLFKFDFVRDPNLILVENDEGLPIRVYPTDDLLTISANSGSVGRSACYKHTRYSCWMTRVYYSQIGFAEISSLIVLNSNNQIVAENLSSCAKANCISNAPITRNDTYTVKYGKIFGKDPAGIVFSSIGAGSFQFSTPEEQKNFKFSCGITGDFGSQVLTCNFPK